jgi:hypothetical protein
VRYKWWQICEKVGINTFLVGMFAWKVGIQAQKVGIQAQKVGIHGQKVGIYLSYPHKNLKKRKLIARVIGC